jgi:hypothetical protein
MEWYLGGMAILSTWLHFHAMEMYIRHENTRTSKTVLDIRIKHPLQRIFLILLVWFEFPRAKKFASMILCVLWAMFFIYYFLIAKLFAASVILNIVNVTTALLTSASFCQWLYRVTEDFPDVCNGETNDLLAVTGGCWELVLAGTVLVQIFLSYGPLKI